MLYKESAIAVMVAVMLGTASLLGGFSTVPALATHDPDAVQVASKTISQADDESVIIDTLELTAKKVIYRTAGMITVAIVQDGEILKSDDFTSSSLTTSYRDIEVSFGGLNVTGSFEILVEFEGSGVVAVSSIEIIEGTETADTGSDDNEDSSGVGTGDDGSNEQEQDIENVIASKTISLDSDETMTIETVEFIAKKMIYRTAGMITVAIVQDGEILKSDDFTSSSLTTSYSEFEIDFGGLEVTDDFQVVIMFEGNGVVAANSIEVPGETETGGIPDPDPNPEPTPSGTVLLVVNAVDQNNQPVAGMWVALLQGMALVDSGETEATFTLNSNEDYIVEMGDFYDELNRINYDFNGWTDSVQDSRRSANHLADNEEFTAKYIVTTDAQPPADDPPSTEDPPTSPPPGSATGTITAYAYRIPSSFWGPTFESANAQMYFVLYNSTGWIVYTGFFDESGNTVTGLNEGETYWIYPTDCDECHDDPHDVVFDHWEDGSTDTPRAVTTGHSVGAYYAFDPDP